MANKFTVSATYDRDEIIEWAKKCQDMGADLFKTRDVLTQLFPAWFLDTRMSLTVELMFRGEDDMFFEFMTAKLAELAA